MNLQQTAQAKGRLYKNLTVVCKVGVFACAFSSGVAA